METNPKYYIVVEGIDFHAPTIAAMSEADFVQSQMDNPNHWAHKGAGKEAVAKAAYAEIVEHAKDRAAKEAKAKDKDKTPPPPPTFPTGTGAKSESGNQKA